MKKKTSLIVLASALTIVLLLTVCVAIYILQNNSQSSHRETPIKNNTVIEGYEITSLNHKEGSIEIEYPYITGLEDVGKLARINEQLKKEAFRTVYFYGGTEDLLVSISYKILFQRDNLLCVSFSGLSYRANAAYPINWFYTSNIDIRTGCKLILLDMLKVDDMFISKIRERFNFYIEQSPENVVESRYGHTIIYESMLNNNDEYFIKLFQNADSEMSSDCFTYFTEDVFGISFATYHSEGDHFAIEFEYEDLEEFFLK